jgi:hypothetical protein
MAYEFARIGVSAGDRLTDLWDGIIVGFPNWSLDDGAAGVNAKTYRCLDAGNNVDFYVYVDDNQADFSIIEIWEDWDNVGHAGVGDSLSGADVGGNLLQVYSSQGVHVMVSDHRILLGASVGMQGYYIGQPIRFDTTKNMPFYLGTTDGGAFYGTLGRYETITNIAWRTLWDHSGNIAKEIRPKAYNSNYKFACTCRGTYIFDEIVVYVQPELICLGYLDGVAHFYGTNNGFFNGMIITGEDGDWLITGRL